MLQHIAFVPISDVDSHCLKRLADILKGFLPGGKSQILIQLVLIRIIIGISLLQPERVAYIDEKTCRKSDRCIVNRQVLPIRSHIPVIVFLLIFLCDFHFSHKALQRLYRVRLLHGGRQFPQSVFPDLFGNNHFRLKRNRISLFLIEFRELRARSRKSGFCGVLRCSIRQIRFLCFYGP